MHTRLANLAAMMAAVALAPDFRHGNAPTTTDAHVGFNDRTATMFGNNDGGTVDGPQAKDDKDATSPGGIGTVHDAIAAMGGSGRFGHYQT